MGQANRRALRILIADDDDEIRSVLGEFLGQHYECSAVNSAEGALAALSRQRFNLIISDITMGRMSGLNMIPHVLQRAPETVIILVSGAQTIETAIDALRAGAFDYITKPFDLQQVEVAVARALNHQGLLEAKRHYESYLEEQIKQRTAELDDALDSIEEAYRMTLGALIAALEMRDTDTHGHSERVVNFSLRLGRELKLDEARMRSLEFGSLLHDIGKIGIPDMILRKPARLTDEEWTTMREHPFLGAQILRGIKFLEGAARVVAEHHERWDGTGYPLGLSGEEIDLNARIFSVADAFDAIISDRVYRRGKSCAEALAELDRYAGRQFDPTVVAAMHRVSIEEWEELRRAKTSRALARGQAQAATLEAHLRLARSYERRAGTLTSSPVSMM